MLVVGPLGLQVWVSRLRRKRSSKVEREGQQERAGTFEDQGVRETAPRRCGSKPQITADVDIWGGDLRCTAVLTAQQPSRRLPRPAR